MNMEEEKIKLSDLFAVKEAFIDCIYGKIRQGKTYAGTAGIWNDLSKGSVVYATWPVKFDGYDERKVWFFRLLGILKLKRKFLVIPKEQLRYKEISKMKASEFFNWFEKLTDCIVYIDEAQWVFDSYIKTYMEKDHRAAIFTTGHFNRALKIITQRPMQIHTSIRANIHRFYKTEKIFNGLWFIPPRFKMTEFQELKSMDAVPDETLDKEGDYLHAESTERFFLNWKVAGSYDNKYLRGNAPSSQENLGYWVRPLWKTFF